MALIIEDGSNVAGANSFVTADEIVAYAALRGVVLDNADNSVDVNAIKAMDYIEAQCFAGLPAFLNQLLPYPRKDIVEGDDEDGYEYSIPATLKKAQMQLALDASRGIELMPSIAGATPQLKSSKVGPIEREYFAAGDPNPILTIANAALQPLLCGQSEFSVKTYRV